MSWIKHCEDSYYRFSDSAYAGKDHTKNDKTFICISSLGEEKRFFKTVDDAMQYVDIMWPEKVEL